MPDTLRGYFRLEGPIVDTNTYNLHSLQYTAATIWNDIPDSINMIDNLAEFKNILWKHMTNVISEYFLAYFLLKRCLGFYICLLKYQQKNVDAHAFHVIKCI